MRNRSGCRKAEPLRVWPALLLILLGGGMEGVLLVGCRPPQTAGLTIAGSTSVQPLVEMLADHYMTEHPGITINVQGGGSSAGVRAALSGAAAIGMASRELKPEEKAQGLRVYLLARDAIALIVHPQNPIRALTRRQLREIFAGRIRRWEQIGPYTGPIHCITREEGSGTRSAFEEMIMGAEAEIAPDAIVQDSTGAARALVAGDPHAIAYISLGMVTSEVAPVAFDGVPPTREAVLSGRYPLTRPFLLLTKGAPTPQAQAFLDYVLSPTSQALVEEEGYIPAQGKRE